MSYGRKKKLNVSISDDGIGISKADLPHIFDRFYRAEKSRTTSKNDGKGLGLSIVKHILKRHNEKISVKSTHEKGTVFKFSLSTTI